MPPRKACGACNGGGRLPHQPGENMGRCRSCRGSGIENDYDYTRRIESGWKD